MKCLEFRKKLLVAPRELTPDIGEHRTHCIQCASFAARIEKMEFSLAEAVLIEPPEGLANRILLRRSLTDVPPAVAPRRRFMALAAKVAVATVGLGGVLYWRRRESALIADRGLARELIAHILAAHPPGLGATTQVVTDIDITGLLTRAGFGARTSLGQVSNAWPCEFRQQPIAHFVLADAANPITALVLPAPFVDQSHHFAGPDLSGVIAPCAHGSLALLTESTFAPEAQLNALVARFQSAIVSA